MLQDGAGRRLAGLGDVLGGDRPKADIDAAMGIDRNKIAAFSSNRPAEALAQAVRGFTDVASSASNAGSALVAEITTG